MAIDQHLAILDNGVDAWNRWRENNPRVRPDLSRADLRGRELQQINFSGTLLIEANLSRADLRQAGLQQAFLMNADLTSATLDRAQATDAIGAGANLAGASMSGAVLWQGVFPNADFTATDLTGAYLMNAVLHGAVFNQAKLLYAGLQSAQLLQAKFVDADLTGADLRLASLVGASLERAILSNCRVYGASAWDVNLKGAIQDNLSITRTDDEPALTVDNLEIAQLIYLMLNNQKLSSVIDTVTSKVVLILGRFTSERKRVLDDVRDELRKHDYVPVMFDFDQPASRNLTETVTLLARLSRFIIADITGPRSIPQELMAIVPQLPNVPVVLLLQANAKEYGMA